MSEPTREAPDTAARHALLVLLDGSFATHPLPASGRVTIGRSEENDVRIDHTSISRRHAVLHVALGGAFEIEDLASANGTHIRIASTTSAAREADDERTARGSGAFRPLRPNERGEVRAGATVQIGAATIVVQRTDLAARPPKPRPQEPEEEREPVRDAIVRDAAMIDLYELAERVADSTITVLLSGETGSGKEVLAETIWRSSKRNAKPFLRLNCAAVSESLLESELFGHERGSFTGAAQPKMGLLEAAEGGTFLLDEIGELPLSVQTKLLRVLEDKEVLRVGAVKPRRVDVRFIAATNRDLEVEVSRGAFRADLYYRLAGVCLAIPPLRRRRSEIVPLAESFIRRISAGAGRPPPQLAEDAAAILASYDWPGNIRELRSIVERALLICAEGLITPHHLPVGKMQRREALAADLRAPATGDDERQRIIDALERCAGNQTQAAKMLGMSRGTLVSRLDRHDLPRPRK